MRTAALLRWTTFPLALAAACAPAHTVPGTPAPPDLAALQAEAGSDSMNVDLLIRLGSAYVTAARPADAQRVLERATTLRPADAQAAFLLGLALDQDDSLASARRNYERTLTLSPPATLRAQTQLRLQLLARRELVAAARRALANERQLANRAPEPRTIAIFPFLFGGGDPQFEPLSRALAELLVTDLSQTPRLRVLERARVQALLDEMKLAERGLVDTLTAARSGRLLGASRVLQGRVGGDEARLKLEALVVPVGAPTRTRSRPLAEQAAARRLFEAEKRLALDVYADLGVQLTPAEKDRITANATQNLQALLEFGRGLEAGDRGDFAGAAGHFEQSVKLDPGFQPAREQAQSATQLSTAAALTPSDGVKVAAGTPATEPSKGAPAPAVRAPSTGLAAEPVLGLNALGAMIPDPSVRDPLAEALGRESLASRATLQIIFLIH